MKKAGCAWWKGTGPLVLGGMLDPEAGSGSVSFLPESVRPLTLTRGSSCPRLHTHTGVPASSEPRRVVLMLGLRQEASQPGGRPWRGPTRVAASVTRRRMLPEAERQASSAGHQAYLLSSGLRASAGPGTGWGRPVASQGPPPCLCSLHVHIVSGCMHYRCLSRVHIIHSNRICSLCILYPY